MKHCLLVLQAPKLSYPIPEKPRGRLYATNYKNMKEIYKDHISLQLTTLRQLSQNIQVVAMSDKRSQADKLTLV